MIYRVLGLAVLVYFFASLAALHRNKTVSRRIFLLYGTILTSIIAAFLFPEFTNRAANAVGITRGADFGIYSLSLFLLFLSFRLVRVNRRSEENFQRLAREIALRERVIIPKASS